MNRVDSHLSDQRLLLYIEAQLSAGDRKPTQTHLDACWKCRARRQELEDTITGFARAYQREFDGKIPPMAGPRALLKARLAQLSETAPVRRFFWFPRSPGWAAAAAVCAVLAIALMLAHSSLVRTNSSLARTGILSIPDSRLTPGATLLVSRPALCAQPNTKNKVVPVATRRRVFEEYGISDADPRLYEVDYLVTPALGGADDIHNLWPHSYSATVWNAHVKDALEDHLRDMVCQGSLDLAEAQREIAANWIDAYKKYFHTDWPLTEHCGECGR
jgi:hypothetical protein